MKRTLFWLLMAGLLAPQPAGAAERVLRLEPHLTEVRFTLGATLHTVAGSFRLRKGEIRFEPDTGAASGRVVIDATTGATGNERRDRNMHRKVLESDRYPEIVFQPERVEGKVPAGGTGNVVLRGVLRIHGSDHPLAIPTEVRVDGDRVEAEGRFRVPYVEWGMEDPSAFLLRVDKFVEVTLTAAGSLEAEDPRAGFLP